jgi:uracil-DNA glycosylase family 4
MAMSLDARQRAMLEAMHVRVWWPQNAPQDEATAVPAAVATGSGAVGGVGGPGAAGASGSAGAAGAPLAAGGLGAAGAPLTTHAALAFTAPPGTPMSTHRATAPPAPTSSATSRLPAAAPAPSRPAAPASSALLAAQTLVAGAADSRAEAIATMDWQTLQQSVAGCQACKLCSSRKNTVFGVGPTLDDAAKPPRVDWLIVGEAPGEQEDLRGEPFVGPAGKLLDNMLAAVGVSRRGDPAEPQRAAFIVNVLKCRPPGNRNPELDEIAQCEPYLKRQIALLQPKIVFAVGRFAVQSLLAASVPNVHATPLGRLRGQVYRYEGVPVVVSYHPAYLLRSLPDKAKAWADLCLAMEQLAASPSPVATG